MSKSLKRRVRNEGIIVVLFIIMLLWILKDNEQQDVMPAVIMDIWGLGLKAEGSGFQS